MSSIKNNIYRFPGPGISFLMVVIASVLTLLSSTSSNSLFLPIAFFLGLLIGCLGSVSVSGREKATRSYTMSLFIFSYSVNITVVYLFAYYFISVSGTPFIPEIGHRNPDDLKYYNVGLELARQWRGEISGFMGDPAIDFKYKGYAYFNGVI